MTYFNYAVLKRPAKPIDFELGNDVELTIISQVGPRSFLAMVDGQSLWTNRTQVVVEIDRGLWKEGDVLKGQVVANHLESGILLSVPLRAPKMTVQSPTAVAGEKVAVDLFMYDPDETWDGELFLFSDDKDIGELSRDEQGNVWFHAGMPGTVGLNIHANWLAGTQVIGFKVEVLYPPPAIEQSEEPIRLEVGEKVNFTPTIMNLMGGEKIKLAVEGGDEVSATVKKGRKGEPSKIVIFGKEAGEMVCDYTLETQGGKAHGQISLVVWERDEAEDAEEIADSNDFNRYGEIIDKSPKKDGDNEKNKE